MKTQSTWGMCSAKDHLGFPTAKVGMVGISHRGRPGGISFLEAHENGALEPLQASLLLTREPTWSHRTSQRRRAQERGLEAFCTTLGNLVNWPSHQAPSLTHQTDPQPNETDPYKQQ